MSLPASMQAFQRQVEELARSLDTLLVEIGKVIVGQRPLLEKLLIVLLCRGHLLLEGVPGLAKTLTLQTLSSCLALQFRT